MKKPSGYIILAHDVLGPITEEEIIATLPEDHRGLPRKIILITPEKIEHGEAMNYHWRSMLIDQEIIFDKEVKPLLEKHPDRQILYFGLAPIALAVHLGHKLSSFRKAKVFLKDHTQKEWQWADNDSGLPIVSGVPQERFKGDGDVVIRFGTRFRIEAEDTEKVVDDAIKDIEIYPPQLKGDLFGSFEQMTPYAEAFRDALDAISSNLPEVHDIHLFAAIPVGMAFLLGQEINPNSHFYVHIYEYTGNQAVPYHLVYTVNEELYAKALKVSPKEKQAFEAKRKDLKKEVEEFRDEELKQEINTGQKHWFKALHPDGKKSFSVFNNNYWSYLKTLDPDRLKTDFLEPGEASEEESEYYYFHDRLMKVLLDSLQERDDLYTAVHLFALRETVRELSHTINTENYSELSSYPKIAEETDYQADVYALLHTFFSSRLPIDDAAKHFTHLIEVHLQILWSFDRANGTTGKMEVHRVNRYLTWYYLLCRIESGAYKSLDQILELLSRKPILELRLHAIKSGVKNKVELNLKEYDDNELGIGLMYKGRRKLYTYAINGVPLSGLLKGLKNHEPEKVKDVLEALVTELSN